MELKFTASYGQGLAKDAEFWSALFFGTSGCFFLAWWVHSFQGFDVVEEWRRVIWLTLLYPSLEEYLFRGLLQPMLLKSSAGSSSWGGFTLANVGTSLAFTALHLIASASLWAILVIVPSLIFGWFRDRHESVFPALILHCSYNLAYFISFGLPQQQS